MKNFLLAASLLALGLATPASADVILLNQLSGTGDNVVFDSISGSVAFGSFNGQHTGFARFTDLSGNGSFTGASNGNDIKISNTSDLNVVVCSDKTNCSGTLLDTSTDVFSLKGTGTVTATVTATDGTFTFNLGAIDPNAQSGFTLLAVNGETISGFTLLDTGGVINDYEHYRINVAAPVPGPIVGAGIPGLLGLGVLVLARVRQKRYAWWRHQAA
jgi:opacity protein-like surface antigen